MKRTSFALSILLVLFAGGVYAEDDEFPIQLTCEVGGSIIYVYVAEKIEKSWFQYHPYTSPSGSFKKWGTEKLFVKCGRKGKGNCSVESNHILLYRKHAIYPMALNLNRRTMKVYGGGECVKGFKEYK